MITARPWDIYKHVQNVQCVSRSSSTDMTGHTDIPTGLYLLEFRATWGQNLPCHQQPAVLMNLGKESRNHLPSRVPISSRATALVCFHISGECSNTHARPTGALFSTFPWIIHLFPHPATHISSSVSSYSVPPRLRSIPAGSESNVSFQHSNQRVCQRWNGLLWPSC